MPQHAEYLARVSYDSFMLMVALSVFHRQRKLKSWLCGGAVVSCSQHSPLLDPVEVWAPSSLRRLEACTHRATGLPDSAWELEVAATGTDTIPTLMYATVESTCATETLLEERMDKRQPTLPVATQQIFSLAQASHVPRSQQALAASQLLR